MSCSWASFVHDRDPNRFQEWGGGEADCGRGGAVAKYGTGSIRAQNIVWDANVTSFAELDTFRATGIDLINQNSLLYLRREGGGERVKKSLVGYKENAQHEKKVLPLHLIIPFLKQLDT
jgi:hypothetical protein